VESFVTIDGRYKYCFDFCPLSSFKSINININTITASSPLISTRQQIIPQQQQLYIHTKIKMQFTTILLAAFAACAVSAQNVSNTDSTSFTDTL
jgi:hypothetical protein